jgi:cyclomaltodextrinase / maltogenic alpha-amylase / neopullulanase
MTVPHWVADAVFYQIFPDRFANGDPGNDPPNVRPWGSPPTVRGFQGGDLRGIVQRLETLLDLGINAIYLNPIFQSASTHRYDTIDYFKIDPKLGGLSDFHTLVEAAHRSGVRVILDGVFNHCARGFFAFNDLLENEAESPYLDWFHVSRFPLRAYSPGHARHYKAWWGIKSLPKFNTAAPAVRRYLFDVARYWIEQGADGWRLDVPNEIDDDAFWAEFRQTVRAANPEAYLLGEIWDTNPRWVGEYTFDGLMHYPVRTGLLGYLNGQMTTQQFAQQVESQIQAYPWENTLAMYTLLGSHDTERALTLYGGDTRKMKLALLFQFAFPGAPAIYYGDEVGVQGGKDPDCRRAFPWDEAAWDHDLRSHVKDLVAVRKRTEALRRGSYHPLLAQDAPPVYAFARVLGEETVLVAVNAGTEPAEAAIPAAGLGLAEGRALKNLLGGAGAVVQDGLVRVHLNGLSGVYLG